MSSPDSLSRRTLLQAGAAIAASLLAGGCSQSDRGATTPRKGPATLPKAKVPVGGGVVLGDANFVVTQPAAGRFVAFVKLCPHAGCAVSQVQDQRITCACHGSAFSIDDGSVLSGPARAALGRATVTDKGETLEISG